MPDEYELIKRLEASIKALPIGYISRKNIKGKEKYYLQLREDGKLKSKYIPSSELESLTAKIDERRKLEEKLKELRKQYPEIKTEPFADRTNVIVGEKLMALTSDIEGFQKRDLYSQIDKYLYGSSRACVCAVYGLRRTGKTTMLLQAIENMTEENFSKSAYIKIQKKNVMADVTKDLDRLWEEGYRYIFIDEVTLMEDFIDTAALFSDIYATMGMKIVLSGTDSLGFWFAGDNELYDRVRMVHTTFIPFREYNRLLGINSIDEYIRYGGTLKLGEIAYDDKDALADDASFRDDETTRRYVDTAISKNIQHSLACCKDGHYFSHLYALYEAGELTSAINRIVEDMNHRFVLSVLTRDFKSHDLGMSNKNLVGERDPKRRTNILEHVDVKAVTERLMNILDIRNKNQQTVELTNSHVELIKRYLKALDLIINCPIEHGEIGIDEEEHLLFTQPGMRYCQAQALVHSLMKDELFHQLWDEEKTYVTERILEEVRGRMMEDIILLETAKALGKNYKVFKLQFGSGEFDMVVRDKENDICAIYEIKHSRECVTDQAKHLKNEEKLSMTTPRYGTLVGRYVLYLGEDIDTDDGVAYRNAESFLINLPQINLESGLEEYESEDEDQGFGQIM